MQARSLGQEDPLEKEMATQSSVLGILENWKIPWKLENPTDRGPCWATVHGSQKRHDLGIKQRLYKYHFLYFSR